MDKSMVFDKSRENMITIYYATLTELEKSNIVSDKETLSCIVEKVNKQRRNKILRCKNEKDKLRSLVAGLLLRFGLALTIAFATIPFAKTD